MKFTAIEEGYNLAHDEIIPIGTKFYVSNTQMEFMV